jgi:N-acetylneuraminic acid mutarotase
MPLKLGEVAMGQIGNDIYTVGEPSSQTMKYNIVKQKWSFATSRPLAGSHHAAVVFDTKLWLFGGFDGNSPSRVQVFDPNAQKWNIRSKVENIPYGSEIGSAVAAVIGNEIYVCGGLELYRLHAGSVAKCAAYTPPTNGEKTGKWRRGIESMLVPVNHAAGGTNGNKLYIFGGRSNLQNRVANGNADLQIYDPATNQWRLGKPIPTARGGMGNAPFIHGKFAIIGGEEREGHESTPKGVFKQVELYDPLTDSWEDGPLMNIGVHGTWPIADASHNKVYVIGGGTKSGKSESTNMVALTVQPTRPTVSNVARQTLVACTVMEPTAQTAYLSCRNGGIISDITFAAKGNAVGGECGGGGYHTNAGEPSACAFDHTYKIAQLCMHQENCQLSTSMFTSTDLGCYVNGPLAVTAVCAFPEPNPIESIQTIKPLPEFTDLGKGCCRTTNNGGGSYRKLPNRLASIADCQTECEAAAIETNSGDGTSNSDGCVGIEYKKGYCELHFKPITHTKEGNGCGNTRCMQFEPTTGTIAAAAAAHALIMAATEPPPPHGYASHTADSFPACTDLPTSFAGVAPTRT